jgi:hypothetical protein
MSQGIRKEFSSATLLSEANNQRYSAAPRHTKNKLLSALGLREHRTQKTKRKSIKILLQARKTKKAFFTY